MKNDTARFSHPGGWRNEREGRQREGGQWLEGTVVDVEETRRRNDGKVHLRHAETAEGEVPGEDRA